MWSGQQGKGKENNYTAKMQNSKFVRLSNDASLEKLAKKSYHQI